MEKIDIKSLEYDELKSLVCELGLPKFRADQIFQWLHVKLVNDFESMTNLSGELRARLAKCCEIRNVRPAQILESRLDGTKKYLFELNDGYHIESVMMRYNHGNTVCVSSQVGCAMGCSFCASTIDGCARNLETSEILSQVY